MGSDVKYILVSQAAKILGSTPKKVHNLLDQGLMRWRADGDNILVNQEDLAEIHRLNIAGEMKPGELIRRLLFLEQKVHRLENAINLILEVSGQAASRFLHMEDSDLYNLYENVMVASGQDTWAEDEMLTYSEIFMKITEVEIDRLNEMMNIDHSWQTFYRLCIDMTRYVVQNRDLEFNLNLQRIRDLLHYGRKNISTIAILFVEKSAQLGPSRRLLAKMAASDIEVFDQLAKQLKTTSRKGHLQIT
jgi:hypothetical protein